MDGNKISNSVANPAFAKRDVKAQLRPIPAPRRIVTHRAIDATEAGQDRKQVKTIDI